MLGLGLNINKTRVFDGAFSFSDSDASTYYDALNTANGGDIDSSTIYGITLDELKEAIDLHFLGLKSDGVYTKLIHYLPVIGGTGATHAICAVTASSLATYSGSPTHNANGVNLTGTEYVNGNFTLSGSLSQNDNHAMQLLNNATLANNAFGARGSTTDTALWVYQSGAGSKIMDNTSAGARISVSNSTIDVPLIGTRRSSTDLDYIVDGSSIGTSSVINAGTLQATTFYWGARNLNGTADNLGIGDFQSGSVGTGLTITQANNFNTRIKTLQTALNRL